MIHFVGAGPGAPDLITLRGKALLEQADIVIYAGSLVNPVLLGFCRDTCRIYNSAHMHLQETLQVMYAADEEGLDLVRLHTGDPSLYGAVQEQADALRERGIAFDMTPGVSSLFAAAAALERGFHGPLPVRRPDRPGPGSFAAGQLQERYARGHCLQGQLAGGTDPPLPPGEPPSDSPGSPDPVYGPSAGRRFSGGQARL